MSFIISCLTNYCYGVKLKTLEIGTVYSTYGKEKNLRVMLLENLDRKIKAYVEGK